MDKRVRPNWEGSDLESCHLGADAYPHSTQVCARDVCMICEDGKWVEIEDEPEEQMGSFRVEIRTTGS